MDYRNNSNPSIRWIDVEMDEDIHIANNFDEFLNGLVSDEFYYDINDNYVAWDVGCVFDCLNCT